MRLELPKLYPITDARLTGLSHAEQLRRMSDGGATLVQLREKHLSPREFYGEVEEALSVARARGVRLIVNDRADIAFALCADGVHLGQEDLPPAAARELLGDQSVIGFSTHNIEQARAAARLPVSYIAIGPIFPTVSKENPAAVVGIDGLRRVRAIVGEIPLVAIGGITLENVEEVFKAGADSVAVINLLLASPTEIETRTMEMLSLTQQTSE